MQPVLLDTSIYISAMRLGESAGVSLREIAGGAPVWLSAVVLEELYAGATGGNRRVIERLEHEFHRAARIAVPNLTDWALAGKALALLGARHGYEHIGRGRLTNDALIAISAARLGITVITANARDFEKIAEFRPFQWQVANPQGS